MTRSLAAALLTVVLVPYAAVAEDFAITGKKLVMAQTPSRAVLVFISRDVIRAPLPGGPDDPRVTGASLRVTSGTAETALFDLPAANWTASSNGTVFAYKNLQAPSGPSAVKVAPSVLSAYVGSYDFSPAENPTVVLTSNVTFNGSELSIDTEGKDKMPLIPLSETLFSVAGDRIEFAKDDKGKVTHFVSFAAEGALKSIRKP